MKMLRAIGDRVAFSFFSFRFVSKKCIQQPIVHVRSGDARRYDDDDDNGDKIRGHARDQNVIDNDNAIESLKSYGLKWKHWSRRALGTGTMVASTVGIVLIAAIAVAITAIRYDFAPRSSFSWETLIVNLAIRGFLFVCFFSAVGFVLSMQNLMPCFKSYFS